MRDPVRGVVSCFAIFLGAAIATPARSGTSDEAFVKVEVHMPGPGGTGGSQAAGAARRTLLMGEPSERVWARTIALGGWETGTQPRVVRTETEEEGTTWYYGRVTESEGRATVRFYVVNWPN